MIDRDKRWNEGRQVWQRPPVVFDPNGYTVDVVHKLAAKAFVEHHHYAGTFTSCKLPFGLFNAERELVGVAVLSQPFDHAWSFWTGGLHRDQGAELGRLVLDPSVAFNGESWFIARCHDIVRELRPQYEAILSYADPVARFDAAGRCVKPEHWGTIYQASNAIYAGHAEARTLVVAPDGTTVNGQALTKIRRRKKGWRYSVEQLVAKGAPAPIDDNLAAWLAAALADWQRVRHPGNLTYLFGLNRRTTKRLRELRSLPYVKPLRKVG